MPDNLKSLFYDIDYYIERALNINFIDIYNILKEYNIHLPNNYYNYYKMVYEYIVEEFQKKRLVKNRTI